MIVCVCNAIREAEVREAVRSGADSPRDAYASVGRRIRCGQCLPFARDVIADERAA